VEDVMFPTRTAWGLRVLQQDYLYIGGVKIPGHNKSQKIPSTDKKAGI